MKLVTWNIQWGRGADGRVDLTRIVGDARRFADFDVLCLQEVADNYPDLPGNDAGNQFAALAALLPGFTPVEGIATDAPDDHQGRRRFGNMMLSRYPVLQIFRHLLPWPADEAQSMQRCALEATLDTPLGPMRVATTHLEYYSPRQRRAQIERLRELQREGHGQSKMERASGEGAFFPLPRGGPVILAGDFNFRPGTDDHALLSSPIDAYTPSYCDAWQIVHPGQAHAHSVGLHDKAQWPGEPFTFDFIFVSENIAGRVRDVRVDAASAASDHQPMMIELD